MKKLMIALACAASFAAMADVTPSSSGFEGITAGTKINEQATDANWVQTDGDPASEVKAYLTEDMATYNGSWGSPLDSAYGLNYLALDTGGGELLRYLAGYTTTTTGEPGEEVTTYTPNTVPVTAEAPVYIDTLVQFTATDPSTEVEIASDAKLAIWMVGDEDNGYQLKVRAGAYDMSDGLAPANYVLVRASTGTLTVAPGTWYRLTVKALKNVLSDPDLNYVFPAFEIYLDGEQLKALGGSLDAGTIEDLDDAELISEESAAAFTAGTYFLSLQEPVIADDEVFTTLASVGFQGSGALDDFIMTTAEPNFLTPVTTLDFTLAWSDAAISAVSYAISNNNAEVTGITAATSGTAITLNSGDTITVTPTFTYPSAYEATYTPDALGKVTALDNAFTFADVGTVTVTVGVNQVALTGLGTSADPYKVGSKAELDFWLAGAGTTYGNDKFYQLTGNVDCENALLTMIPGVFTGTLDGQNYTISNFRTGAITKDASKGRDYTAFFYGLGDGAAISNITFNGQSITTATQVFASLVAVESAGNVRLENVTTKGYVEGNYNAAGMIVVVAENSTTTFVACTNEAAIFNNGGNKAVGFVLYSSDAKAVTLSFTDCENKGTVGVDYTAGGNSVMAAGFMGYFGAASDVEFVRCANTGTICGTNNCSSKAATDSNKMSGFIAHLQTGGGTYSFEDCSSAGEFVSVDNEGIKGTTYGSFISKGAAVTVVATGTNTALAAYKPLGSTSTCAALNFAEVDAGVATFCAASAITSNKVYYVMLDNSDAIEFGETAGDYITLFNTPATYSGTCEGENPTVTTASGLSVSVQATMESYTYVLSGGGSGATFADDGAEDLLEEGSSVTADDVATYVAGVTGAAAPAEVTKPMVLSYMLKANKILTTPETEVIKITAIEQVSGGWKITVAAALNAADVAAGATVDMFDITGTLAVSATADLGTAFAPVAAANFTVADGDVAGTAVITVTDANAKFLKATVTK